MTTTKNEELEKRIIDAERSVYRADDKVEVAVVNAKYQAESLANQLKDIQWGVDRDEGIKRVERLRKALNGYLNEISYWEEKRIACIETVVRLRCPSHTDETHKKQQPMTASEVATQEAKEFLEKQPPTPEEAFKDCPVIRVIGDKDIHEAWLISSSMAWIKPLCKWNPTIYEAARNDLPDWMKNGLATCATAIESAVLLRAYDELQALGSSPR